MKLTTCLVLAYTLGCSCTTEYAPDDHNSDDLQHLLSQLQRTMPTSVSPKPLNPSASPRAAPSCRTWRNMVKQLRKVFRSSRLHKPIDPMAIQPASRPTNPGITPRTPRQPAKVQPERPRRSNDKLCASSEYKVGDAVQVMSLSPGEVRSDRWIRARVRRIHCDGTFSLTHLDGSKIRPALKTGIQEYHLRRDDSSQQTRFEGERALRDLKAAEDELRAAKQAVAHAQQARSKAKAEKLQGIDRAIQHHSAELRRLKQQRWCAKKCYNAINKPKNSRLSKLERACKDKCPLNVITNVR